MLHFYPREYATDADRSTPGSSQVEDATMRNVGPISKLHEDVLWKVFLVNADMKNDKGGRTYVGDKVAGWTERALTITWTCSHVCRRWRQLIIHSPSLWGKLIDLDGLASIRPQWKDEIMRRTGSATLSVKGSVFAQKPTELSFALSILQDHWPRIQNLKLRISRGSTLPSRTWKLFYRPAPALQSFYLESRDGFQHPMSPTPSFGLIFANHVPLIRHFGSWRYDLKFTPEMTWISCIRRLDVSYNSSMSIDDWLLALGNMPQIEHLNLMLSFPFPPDTRTTTQVHLPNLAEICVNNRLRAWAVFLAQITPGIGCHLSVSTVDEVEPYHPLDLTLATQVLSRYSQNWFNNRIVTTLSLSVLHTSLFIRERLSNPDAESFQVDVGCAGPDELSTITPLLQAFSSCDFKNITTFDLLIDLFPFQVLDSSVHRFLASLPSVETLQIILREEPSAFIPLQNALILAGHEDQELQTPVLPHVRTVKLLGPQEVWTPETIEAFLPFLILRMKYQAPIQVLDLTDCQIKEGLHILDEITGLKVVYNSAGGIQEHICGA
ncbi:hypothetical protein GALMADRAFT_256929 [Galerina marginata CBS 339.88]|uniref:F-box domain-containing protein n=1 Tax=Galerina marginata (strain CBS 339.88) TaxID=685588 RepID=A0A067SCL8_GALM3|nr:hypothetical protein GALMADRAFT_256929 [Galerina marginata CBS 339.88]